MNRLKKRTSAFFGLALVTTVLLTACGATASTLSGASPAPPAERELPRASSNFEIAVYTGQEVLGGETVDFADVLDQDKPVVLNLWAGLCPPCRLEMPEFQEVYDQFGEQVILVGLDVGPFTNLGTSEEGQSLVETLGISYPTGTTDDADIVTEYQLLGMPTTVFITADGRILRTWTGLLTGGKLAELVEELVSVSASL
jgi:thiol-disulfide isomerase/thioredoxin